MHIWRLACEAQYEAVAVICGKAGPNLHSHYKFEIEAFSVGYMGVLRGFKRPSVQQCTWLPEPWLLTRS